MEFHKVRTPLALTPSYSYLEIGRNVVEQNGNYDGNIDQYMG